MKTKLERRSAPVVAALKGGEFKRWLNKRKKIKKVTLTVRKQAEGVKRASSVRTFDVSYSMDGKTVMVTAANPSKVRIEVVFGVGVRLIEEEE